ncbi:hypothetical protein GOL95_33000 [Sinorhizobium medicae]|nr:hypothetical protein [Sinorhizobium medicae]MDX1244634.1 hypothetical protein [Sinorhizobium medicae]
MVADSDEAAPSFRDGCAPGIRDDLAPLRLSKAARRSRSLSWAAGSCRSLS